MLTCMRKKQKSDLKIQFSDYEIILSLHDLHKCVVYSNAMLYNTKTFYNRREILKFQFVLFVSHWTSLISAVIIIYILFQSKAFLQIFPSYVTSLDQCITWIWWSTYCVIGRVCSKMRNRNRNTNIVVFGNKKKNNGHLWLHLSRNLSLKCDFNEQNSFKMYLRRFEKYSIPFGKKKPPKILQVAERS